MDKKMMPMVSRLIHLWVISSRRLANWISTWGQEDVSMQIDPQEKVLSIILFTKVALVLTEV